MYKVFFCWHKRGVRDWTCIPLDLLHSLASMIPACNGWRLYAIVKYGHWDIRSVKLQLGNVLQRRPTKREMLTTPLRRNFRAASRSGRARAARHLQRAVASCSPCECILTSWGSKRISGLWFRTYHFTWFDHQQLWAVAIFSVVPGKWGACFLCKSVMRLLSSQSFWYFVCLLKLYSSFGSLLYHSKRLEHLHLWWI